MATNDLAAPVSGLYDDFGYDDDDEFNTPPDSPITNIVTRYYFNCVELLSANFAFKSRHMRIMGQNIIYVFKSTSGLQ